MREHLLRVQVIIIHSSSRLALLASEREMATSFKYKNKLFLSLVPRSAFSRLTPCCFHEWILNINRRYVNEMRMVFELDGVLIDIYALFMTLWYELCVCCDKGKINCAVCCFAPRDEILSVCRSCLQNKLQRNGMKSVKKVGRWARTLRNEKSLTKMSRFIYACSVRAGFGYWFYFNKQFAVSHREGSMRRCLNTN
jgi:hypothetical protein